MAKYIKKPIVIVIEAFRYGIDDRPDWFQDKVTSNEIITYCGDELSSPFQRSTNLWCEIHTLEGRMKASYGDYIVEDANGDIFSCRPEIFEMLYEPADEVDKMVEKEMEQLRAIREDKG
ncbi:TPA: hypothetical protein SUB30_004788 [Bacillus pseudomycoides]|nr:hypothetical protein [Bacillus pseudomycoides]